MRLIPMLLWLALTAAAPHTSPTPADEAAIRQSVLAMTDAFNARDDAALIALATPDADWVTVAGRWTRGTQAYVDARRSRFAGPLKSAALRSLETRIRFVRPDVAIVHVTHEIRGMLDQAGKPLPPHPELSTRVYVKQNGRWLISAFHNTGLPPR